MSEYNVYLVPVDEPSTRKRGVKTKVVKCLDRHGIVHGFYDEALGWYAAGPSSTDLFVDVEDDDPAFEYAIVYDRQDAHFVPDSHTGAFDAQCSDCKATIDEAIYEMLNEEDDDVQDMTGRAVVCPSCAHPNPLESLNAGIDTALTRFFLNFCVVDTFEFNPKIIAELERIVGGKLRVVPERL